MKFIMYNKNGCGQGYSLSIGAWDVGVVIMVPRNHFQKLRPMTYMYMWRRAHYVHVRTYIFTCGREYMNAHTHTCTCGDT